MLAWILRAWDSGTATIYLLMGEKKSIKPYSQGYAQLLNIRGPNGQDVVHL